MVFEPTSAAKLQHVRPVRPLYFPEHACALLEILGDGRYRVLDDEPSADRYTAIRLYDDVAWEYSGQRGICVRIAAAGLPDTLERLRVEFIRLSSLAESVAAMEARRATLEPEAYEVVANEFLSGELPRSPPRKSADHVFLDAMDLALRQRHTLADDELARLRAIGSPWALLLELRAQELVGTLPEDGREARLAAWCAPNALRANDTYAHLCRRWSCRRKSSSTSGSSSSAAASAWKQSVTSRARA